MFMIMDFLWRFLWCFACFWSVHGFSEVPCRGWEWFSWWLALLPLTHLQLIRSPVFPPPLSTWCMATLLALLAELFDLVYLCSPTWLMLCLPNQPPCLPASSTSAACIHSTLDPPWLNHLCLRLSLSLHHCKQQLLYLLSLQPKPSARALLHFCAT